LLTYQDECHRGKKSEGLGFMVKAETIENQTQVTFEDAGGEENGPDLSGRIDWFSEFVNENDRGGFPAAKLV